MGCSHTSTKEDKNKQKKSIQRTKKKTDTKNIRIKNTSIENQVPQTTIIENQTNENVKEKKNTRIDIKSTLNKEKCNILLSKLPKRETTNLTSFKESIKNLTLTLTPSEKAYILFLWIGENLDYDAEKYFARAEVDVTIEGVLIMEK